MGAKFERVRVGHLIDFLLLMHLVMIWRTTVDRRLLVRYDATIPVGDAIKTVNYKDRCVRPVASDIATFKPLIHNINSIMVASSLIAHTYFAQAVYQVK